MEPSISNCPFCGGDKLSLRQEPWNNVLYFRITCTECSAFGPEADSFEGASELWNMRRDKKEKVESE